MRTIADKRLHSHTGKFSSTLLGHTPDEADRLLRRVTGRSLAARELALSATFGHSCLENSRRE